MAIRKIRVDTDPLLRKVSREVTEFGDKIKQLSEDMIDTMIEANGVGLAAPQVGVLKRIIVISLDEDGKDYEDSVGEMVLINPEIVESSGEQCLEEGCLSVPGRIGKVVRPERVKVNYKNLDSEKMEMEAEGFLARVLSHEIDHLNGILYIDKMTEEVFINSEE